VFPNPVADLLNVELPYQDEWTISMGDETGRIIFTKKSTELIPVFDTKKLVLFKNQK